MDQSGMILAPMGSEEWISQDELVARWKVSKTTIRRLRQSGKLSSFEITPALFRFKMVDILRVEREGKLLPALAPRRKSKRQRSQDGD